MCAVLCARWHVQQINNISHLCHWHCNCWHILLLFLLFYFLLLCLVGVGATAARILLFRHVAWILRCDHKSFTVAAAIASYGVASNFVLQPSASTLSTVWNYVRNVCCVSKILPLANGFAIFVALKAANPQCAASKCTRWSTVRCSLNRKMFKSTYKYINISFVFAHCFCVFLLCLSINYVIDTTITFF